MSLAAWSRSTPFTRALFVCLVGSALLSGCNIFDTTCQEDDRTCLGGGLLRSGEICVRNGECAVGLECNSGVCEYSAATDEGDKCLATLECGKGLYCSSKLVCAKISADPNPQGGACSSSADCEKGLFCDIDAATLFSEGPYGLLSEECQAALAQQEGSAASDAELPEGCSLPKQCKKRGKKDDGAPCKSSSECLAGLYCVDLPSPIDETEDTFCTGSPDPLDEEIPSLPLWENDSCPKDTDAPTAYFEVPRNDDSDKDFYRLPFPNDIRMRDGKIDLSAHPVPPSELGVPVVERFLEAAGESLEGFGTNAIAYFRFSQPYMADKDKTTISGSTVRIVDITKSSPEYNRPASIEWGPSGVKSNYICSNWLALRRPTGSPLRGGTTYAAILTTGIRPKAGGSYARSSDLVALLADSAPSDAVLASAHATYAPLRAWLADTGTDPSTILNAAVFTTQDPEALMPKLRAAIDASDAPTVKDLVKCADGVKSPCEDDAGRGACRAQSSRFTEYHGRISLPIFQEGTAPYDTAGQGSIAVNADGDPVEQGRMDVCFALSVPTQAMPADGYPVMLYGHGTGGSFAGQMGAGGLAEEVAGGPSPAALLAIDLPEHGSRRGASTRPPEDLFFNFANPQAARGNVLQGSADLMSLARFVQTGIEDNSVTGGAVRFDRTRVLVMGHSQGATHAALMLPHEPRAQAGVLSGVGGHLATSLRLKEKPVDIGAILPFVLFDNDDGELAGGSYNPALALVQAFFESADPINYARSTQKDPLFAAPDGQHLFMTFGLLDSYSPERTQEAYAVAAGLTAVLPLLRDGNYTAEPAPLLDNAVVNGMSWTIGMRQYMPPAGVDGHFVATGSPEGRADLVRFLQRFLDGKAPQIGQ